MEDVKVYVDRVGNVTIYTPRAAEVYERLRQTLESYVGEPVNNQTLAAIRQDLEMALEDLREEGV